MNAIGFGPSLIVSERDGHTLTATVYTPTDGGTPTFYITKRYSTGREQSVGMTADEARALIENLSSLLDRMETPATTGHHHAALAA